MLPGNGSVGWVEKLTMKIAFLLYHWPVLSETFIMNQICGLLDRGHEVDIYAKSPGRAPVIHADVVKYGLLKRTHYYGSLAERMPVHRFVRLTKAIGLLIRNARRKPMPLLRSLNFFRLRRQIPSLGLFYLFYTTIPFLDADRYDVVHCHFGPNGNLAVLLRDVGVIKGKIVTSFHGEAGCRGLKRYERGFKLVFEKGDLLLPVSESERRNLIELGCSPHKIVVHRMGVDLDRFRFTPRRSRDDGKVRVLSVARLVEVKGIEYAIRAVARVIEKYPHIEYNIAGDGPLKGELAHLAETLNVAGKVKFLGWRRQEEIVELLEGSDILLAPSVTSKDEGQEGLPIVLMEALAQGLPVLSTNYSGIPELVQDGVSGFLVPERDTDVLAERLGFFVGHPEIWPEMGRAGREHVERHHDIEKLNDRLVLLYQQLLSGEVPHLSPST